METKQASLVAQILIAAIAALPPTILAYAALVKAQENGVQAVETHAVVNSRMTEMIALVKESSAAKATLVEKEAEKTRQGEKAVDELKQKELTK